jgi:hypothetical protein
VSRSLPVLEAREEETALIGGSADQSSINKRPPMQREVMETLESLESIRYDYTESDNNHLVAPHRSLFCRESTNKIVRLRVY